MILTRILIQYIYYLSTWWSHQWQTQNSGVICWGLPEKLTSLIASCLNAIKENNSILTKPIYDESALLIDSCDVPSLHTRLHDAGIYRLITPAAMKNVIWFPVKIHTVILQLSNQTSHQSYAKNPNRKILIFGGQWNIQFSHWMTLYFNSLLSFYWSVFKNMSCNFRRILGLIQLLFEEFTL